MATYEAARHVPPGLEEQGRAWDYTFRVIAALLDSSAYRPVESPGGNGQVCVNVEVLQLRAEAAEVEAKQRRVDDRLKLSMDAQRARDRSDGIDVQDLLERFTAVAAAHQPMPPPDDPWKLEDIAALVAVAVRQRGDGQDAPAAHVPEAGRLGPYGGGHRGAAARHPPTVLTAVRGWRRAIRRSRRGSRRTVVSWRAGFLLVGSMRLARGQALLAFGSKRAALRPCSDGSLRGDSGSSRWSTSCATWRHSFRPRSCRRCSTSAIALCGANRGVRSWICWMHREAPRVRASCRDCRAVMAAWSMSPWCRRLSAW